MSESCLVVISHAKPTAKDEKWLASVSLPLLNAVSEFRDCFWEGTPPSPSKTDES